jgi:hypothetical protein
MKRKNIDMLEISRRCPVFMSLFVIVKLMRSLTDQSILVVYRTWLLNEWLLIVLYYVRRLPVSL